MYCSLSVKLDCAERFGSKEESMSSGYPPIGNPGGVNPAVFSAASGPSVRRPRRFWYAVGAALIVIGAIASITLFVVVLVHLMGRAPTDDRAFGNNERTTVHVDAGASKTIYVTNRTYSPSTSCTAASADAGPNPDLSPYGASVILSNWRALFAISAQNGGDFVISCSGPVSNARYGVGDHIAAGDIAYPFMGIGAGAPFIVAGIAVLIVAFVRRSRSAAQRQ
jgi:hypothetical protein